MTDRKKGNSGGCGSGGIGEETRARKDAPQSSLFRKYVGRWLAGARASPVSVERVFCLAWGRNEGGGGGGGYGGGGVRRKTREILAEIFSLHAALSVPDARSRTKLLKKYRDGGSLGVDLSDTDLLAFREVFDKFYTPSAGDVKYCGAKISRARIGVDPKHGSRCFQIMPDEASDPSCWDNVGLLKVPRRPTPSCEWPSRVSSAELTKRSGATRLAPYKSSVFLGVVFTIDEIKNRPPSIKAGRTRARRPLLSCWRSSALASVPPVSRYNFENFNGMNSMNLRFPR